MILGGGILGKVKFYTAISYSFKRGVIKTPTPPSIPLEKNEDRKKLFNNSIVTWRVQPASDKIG